MRKAKVSAALLGVAIGANLLTITAHADRRTGLGGNILIEDPDDLFPFPQYTLQHRNMFRLDYGASAPSGNGVLTLGNEEQAVALSVHRGDILSPDIVGFNQEFAWRAGVANPFASTSFADFTAPDGTPAEGSVVLPATVLDLSYARALGRDAVGVRFGFGRGVQAVKVDGDGVTKGAQTFFGAQVGYSSAPPDGLRYDLSANAVFAFGKVVVDDVDLNGGWDLRIAALGRGYYPINRIVDVGVIGNVSLENEHSRDDVADAESNAFDFGLMGGVGPVIRLDRAKIASYAGVRLGVGKTNPGPAEENTNRLRFAAPMVNMAAEVQVLDWLYVRTGAEYNWQLSRDAAETASIRAANGAFRWAAGLGVRKDTFYFDGVVQNDFVTGGPNFIGGNANGFLAIASLTYKFGDVFGAAPLEARDPAPAPAAEPVEAAPIAPAEPAPEATPVLPTEPDPELGATTVERDAPARDSVGGRVGGSGRVEARRR